MKTTDNRQRGFTLMELMITVAIVAILATLVIPSYMEQVKKTKRSDAKVELLKISQLQESYFVQNLSYAKTLTQLGLSANSIATENNEYTVTVDTVAPAACAGTSVSSCQAFTLKATPRVGGPQENDSQCTQFTLASSGLKGTSAGATAAEVRKCWK